MHTLHMYIGYPATYKKTLYKIKKNVHDLHLQVSRSVWNLMLYGSMYEKLLPKWQHLLSYQT